MCLEQEGYENKKTLEEIFKLYSDELYENTQTNRRLAKKIIKKEEEFYEQLTKEQKQVYEQLNDLQQLNYEETDKNIFIEGFRMAVRIMAECIF